ncbi:Arc family DNA-binding protein [Pseudomonas chengduensis]|nr:Arc family DNA-binding protein [Pseudomonas chengduensis]NNB75235.1 Arc family DNA-binding protein [Pseudomonas chengduensis]
MNRALSAARTGPAPRPRYSSRTADKFVIRGYSELFEELGGIGQHQGRSKNSEMVAAILEALSGNMRMKSVIMALRAYLGHDLADKVLAEVPDFILAECKVTDQFVIRLPPSVRDTIREGVSSAISAKGASVRTMNQWVLNALEQWVNLQRQQYALTTAAIAIDQTVFITAENH